MEYLLVVRPRIKYYVATPYRPNRIFQPEKRKEIHHSQSCLGCSTAANHLSCGELLNDRICSASFIKSTGRALRGRPWVRSIIVLSLSLATSGHFQRDLYFVPPNPRRHRMALDVPPITLAIVKQPPSRDRPSPLTNRVP